VIRGRATPELFGRERCASSFVLTRRLMLIAVVHDELDKVQGLYMFRVPCCPQRSVRDRSTELSVNYAIGRVPVSCSGGGAYRF
jgi:hypothetical protein